MSPRDLLAGIEAGRFPEPDGLVEVIRPECDRDIGVFAFTAHTVVSADVEPDWCAAHLPDGDLSAPVSPPFLTALASRLGRRINLVDSVLLAPALPGPPPVPMAEIEPAGHPRVARALRYRAGVRTFATEGAVLVLGRGVGGRTEAAVEVDPGARGRGLGRALAAAARHLCGGTAVWAQVTPGNAASVRAFLAAGYCPVGAEVLLPPGRDD